MQEKVDPRIEQLIATYYHLVRQTVPSVKVAW